MYKPLWRKWIAHPTSNREVPGSSPGGGIKTIPTGMVIKDSVS